MIASQRWVEHLPVIKWFLFIFEGLNGIVFYASMSNGVIEIVGFSTNGLIWHEGNLLITLFRSMTTIVDYFSLCNTAKSRNWLIGPFSNIICPNEYLFCHWVYVVFRSRRLAFRRWFETRLYLSFYYKPCVQWDQSGAVSLMHLVVPWVRRKSVATGIHHRLIRSVPLFRS